MAELPTIAIVNPKRPDQCCVINTSDFDSTRHVRWEDRPAPQAVVVEEIQRPKRGGRR